MPATQAPYSQYFDKNGDALDAGYVWFGQPNQNPKTVPINVYWDANLTQPAPQPLRTLAGYISRNGSPAQVFTDGAYSQTVENKRGEMVYYAANSTDYSDLPIRVAVITGTDGQTLVTLPFSYTRGNNSLAVYQNGILLLKDKDYTETSTTSITLVKALRIGPNGADEITAIGGRLINAASAIDAVSSAALAAGSGAGLVGYDPSLTFPANTVGERLQATTYTVDAITSVDAVALRLVDGDMVLARGRTSPGDGGGGMFRYVAASVQATDGGLVFQPTAGAGRLLRDGMEGDSFNGPVYLRWFGAIGDGASATADTAALTLALAYMNDNFATSQNRKSQLMLGSGDFVFNRVSINSLRGVTITGEGTQDPTRVKTRWKFSGTGGTDAMLQIISCANFKFKGIYFDLNSVEGMDSMIQFASNESTAAPPLNRFSCNWVTFDNCIFFVQPAIVAQPAQMIWAKSCSSTFFNECGFYAQTSLRLGKDTDVDPNTGGPTIADGLCVITKLQGCYILGDIVREKSYNLSVEDCQMFNRNGLTTMSVFSVSGGALCRQMSIKNLLTDATGVSTYAGTLVQGGTHVDSGNLSIKNSQLDGRATLVAVSQGTADISTCRPIARTTSSTFVSIGSAATSVSVFDNETEEYLAGNTGGSIVATLIADSRSSKWLPVLVSDQVGANVALAAAGAYTSILSTTYKFGGQYVRICYSITVEHTDGGTQRYYTARVRLNGTAISQTIRRISMTAANEYGILTCNEIVYIAPQDNTYTLDLQVNQASGAVLGNVLGSSTSTSRSTWNVELLNT